MTVREEYRKNMRHSSSWPDRARPQTVKVRVDPLSRAFTIIPTVRDRLHPLLSSKSDWIDEIVFLDRGSVESKRRFVNEIEAIDSGNNRQGSGEAFELRTLVPDDVMNKSSAKVIAEDEPKLSSSSDKTKSGFLFTDERLDTILQEETNFRSEVKESLKYGPDDGEFLRLQTIVNIERVDPDEERREGQGSSGRSAPKRLSTPHIQIVDYDYITSYTVQSERTAQHACPKCTPEGLLLERMDPFRSPVSSGNRKSSSGRYRNGSEPETVRKYSASEGKMRNSWRRIGASGLIGGARNRERKKYARKRAAGRALNEPKKETTLRRHYYPEGGWGYVIATCSALVHFIGIGLQLAAPASWYLTAQLKFHQPALHSAGMSDLFFYLWLISV
ncbi:uncharacterized protein LOC108629562 [Ceratina calcarata]|uniref:Uncharacterized protein LOC108629562 n=1 Tax=Ceratina calcarata TaxID=156304 RepID=A0AAJ7J995_9HYME|nr:uncharacterized protein LOC108629562 [Ceratina calcarata]